MLLNLKEMKQAKRYTLMVLMIQSKLSQSLDDVAGIFKRKLNKLHQSAETRLMEYHQEHTQRTEKLISQFRNVLKTYGDNEAGVPPSLSDIRNAMSEEPAILLAECEEHLAYAGNNYYPFMLKLYKPQRAQLLNCLELLELGSSSEDSSILLALETILEYRNTHKQELGHYEEFVAQPWVNDKWKKLIFNADTKTVNRKYFELCVLSRIKNELSSGDLFIRYSLEHSDYRKELISWDEYEQGLSEYTDMLGFSKDSKTFATELKKTLSELSTQVDEQFQSNEFLDFNNDQLVIRRHQNIPEPQQLKKLDEALRDSLEEKSIVDILVESEQWLDAHKLFKPVSGFESKLDNPRKRFISTLFCYGCNLGPTQTARSIKTLSRKQVAWLNLKYVTEEKLEKAIVKTVNAYNKFELTYHCIASILLAYNEASYEVILADDCSTDITCEAETIIENLVISRNSENLRFLRSCNRATEIAKGDYIIFLNNDTEVSSFWIDELVEKHKSDGQVGLTGSKLLNLDGSMQEAGGIVWGNGQPWNVGRDANPLQPEFNYAREVDYVSGAAMCIPKTIWEEVGRFSEELAPCYYEDTDLAFKVRDTGYKTVYVPTSEVVHFEGQSHGRDVTKGLKRYQVVNEKTFRNKWFKAFKHNGVPVALITNKPSVFVKPMLDHFELTEQFGWLLGSDTLEEKKPSAMPLLYCSESIEALPENCLMIGDSITDFNAAKNAGFKCALVTYGYHQGVDLKSLGADAVIDDLAELLV